MIARPLRLLLPLFVLALAACGTAADPAPAAAPEVTVARIVLPPPGAPMAAGYFELTNRGPSALELRGVSSTAFASIEMHETVEEQGLSRMRAIDSAKVAPGETLRFEPGGKHLMLMDPKLGDPAPPTLSLTLDLRAADGTSTSIQAPFTVEQAGGTHEHHHH